MDSNANGGFDFNEVIGNERVKVKAPDGAFPAGTQMKISSVHDTEDLAKVAAALDSSQIHTLFALDISFWYEGSEVEPQVPVEVTWESANIDSEDCRLVHLSDTGKVEIVEDAAISADKAVFTADSFSEWALVSTTRLSTVPIEHFTFNPSNITTDVTEITSGAIADNAPAIAGYTFKSATVQLPDNKTDTAVEVGAFIARYEDEDGAIEDRYKVYYRTAETLEASDIIVLIAGQAITLNYEPTPNNVTYCVVYNGETYTVGNDELPTDLANLVFSGPSSVPAAGEEKAVNVTIPRGFLGTVHIEGNTTTTASLGVEPEYTIVSGSDNKTIGKTSSSVEALDLDGVYDLPGGSSSITVTLTLTKRSSFTFNARHFLGTVYTGGNGYNSWGDTAITGYRQNYARVTTDSAYSLNSNTAANRGTRSFTGDGTIWAFTTIREASDDISDPNDVWMLDALEINETTIELPYNEGESKSTALPSGTVVTVTLDSVTPSAQNGSGYRRHYILSVSNCYENIVITGGNIVNAASSTEIIPEVLENVDYEFYGYSTADNAYARTGLGWQSWGVGEPISAGATQSTSQQNRNWNMYGFNQTNNNAMRFRVADGYEAPEIAFVSTSGTDLISYINGPTRGSKNSDGYYPITSNPNNGYYYFRVTGIGGEHVANLRIRASLIRYGVTYSAGAVSDATVPAYDNGGTYGDESVRGYNVEDNDVVVLNKSIPSDPTGNYVFEYYTIGTGTTHYAPGQKINLVDLIPYAGATKNSDGLYEIPVTAHWIKKEIAKTVTITVKFFLDDAFERSVDVQVTKDSAIYIDIDSDEMANFMDDYNWQLFYDEIGSKPYIEKADQNYEVELRVYSKFYVYHSATDTLELHTTKEMETGTGAGRKIGKLDITALTTEGYYYGGYYKDYLGCHKDGTNLVKAAADSNNLVGTLTTADIVALSNKRSVEIPEYSGNTQYDPVNDESHLTYWTRANAFTTSLKNSDTNWFSDRGSKDTTVLQTGGTGTAVTIARAGIYYLHEVPKEYLATPKVATVKEDYGNGAIKKMFLLSVADLNIFRAGGINIKKKDTEGSDKKGSFAKSFTLTKYDDGQDAVVEAATITKTAKQLHEAYGYHIVTDGATCIAGGEFDLDPYWITYDNVTIHGSDVTSAGHVRTITVSGNTVS